MLTIQGKGVSAGIAIGKIFVYKKEKRTIKRIHTEDSEKEMKSFEEAKEKSEEQLKKLYDKALHEVGEANAAIFEVHQMMLNDLDYNDSVINIIKTQKVNAAYAVATTADNFSKMFSEMDDDYMRERAADVEDISERLLNNLLDNNTSIHEIDEPVILMADDLAPSETVQMDKSKLLAFVTRKGSSNSHTAILARMMGIPSVIQADIQLNDDNHGKMAIVDGNEGTVFIDPDESFLYEMRERKQVAEDRVRLLETLKGKENITKKGTRLDVFANIASDKDLAQVLEYDAGGVGLFRSEFLYLEKKDYPTEEEQFVVYKRVAENMAGKKVVIRTLDIGADKTVDYFQMEQEENPAMGYRAIRICLDRTDVFKTQLRAIYRASYFGKISIMFPMITSVEEIKEIKSIVDNVKSELYENGIQYGEVELGIMIETPAAAIISDLLAKEVDFFSIGTNDLSQYVLAIDRQNAKIERYYLPHHLAILRLIEMVIINGHKENIWVGICGELAADKELTETFVKMGIDELSVSPRYILEIRQTIRSLDI